jgi:lysozyme
MQDFSKNTVDIKFIHNSEGFRSRPYRDTGGVWTIGFGNTYWFDRTPISWKTPEIDLATANRLFDFSLEDFKKIVAKYVTIPLNDNQYSALVSLAYNSGVPTPEFAWLINNNRMTMRYWRNYKIRDRSGRMLQGLINRRVREFNLWNTPITQI